MTDPTPRRGGATDHGPRPIGYLTKRFPRLSETFILDEVLGLEGAGVPLRLFAVQDPRETLVQPDVARVRSTVTYLRGGTTPAERLRWAGTTVARHARLAAAHPTRYLRTLARALGTRERRASLSHFVAAGRLATLLDDAGAWHLHAAFAHTPAAIAHQVHLLTGRPFSFAAHAKDLYVSDPAQLARRTAAAEFVLVCSDSARRALATIAGPRTGRIHLAYHGVDVARFVPARVGPATDPDLAAPGPTAPGAPHGGAPRAGMPDTGRRPVRLLATGRLVEKKGYPVLLDAIARLRDAGHAVECRIVGAGPLRAELETRTTALGIGASVTFEGARRHTEVAALYHQADVFVQCSVVLPDGDRDGIPNVVLEAMASGLPVVASDVAGLSEAVVDGVTGLLVPPADPAAVAGAIERLLGDPALGPVMGAAARSRALDRFDRSRAIRAVASLMLEAPRGAAGLGTGSADPGARLPVRASGARQ